MCLLEQVQCNEEPAKFYDKNIDHQCVLINALVIAL